MRMPVSWALRPVIVSAGAALLVSVVFAILSILAASRDPEPIRAAARDLLTQGTPFRTFTLPLGGRAVPAWEGNDCLILSMLVLPPENLWRDALSPRRTVRSTPNGGPPAELVQSWCKVLEELLDPNAPAEPTFRYDRYLQGHRVVGALAIPVLGAEGLRGTIRTILIGGLAALALLAALAAWHQRFASWHRDAGFAWIGFGMLLFHGLPIFSGYWSHALPDLAALMFLWSCWLRPARTEEPDAGPAWLLGSFGATTAIFEFLTGGLPLGGALVLLVAALSPFGPTWRGMALSLTGFAIGVAVPIITKLLIGSHAFSDFMATEAAGQLLHRLHGPVVAEMSPREIATVGAWGFDVLRLDAEPWLRLPYVIFRLAYFAFVPGLGSTILGLIVLGVSAIGLCLLGLRMRKQDPLRVIAVVGACGIVFAWYGLFLSHTLLHTAWMVRCIVVLPLACGVLLVFAFCRQGQGFRTDPSGYAGTG